MFVGRKEENTKLTNALHETLKGKSQVVFVTGEAGMGKTTLVEHWWNTISKEFEKNLEGEPPVFAKSSCSIPVGGVNVGELEALQPFSDLISSVYRNSGDSKTTLKKVRSILLEAAPDWLEAIPVVGKVAAAGVKTYSLYKKDKLKHNDEKQKAASSQQQIFQQYVKFLNNLADSSSAVVIWIDDIHWADRSSLNLLFYLARETAGRPVMIIAAYRPEEIIQTSSETHTLLKIKNEILRYELGKVIELEYFSENEVNSFLAGRFKDYTQDKDFEKWLLKISGGNALFITQYINTLVEDGFINDPGEVLPDYISLKSPGTVRAVVEERIRRLEENVLENLRYATAEGEEFTSYIVTKLTGKPPLEVLKILKKAETGIIKNLGSMEVYSNQKTTLFKFIHALFYNALYDSLSEEEKTILHRECLEALKTEWEKDRKNILLSTKTLAHAEKSEEFYEAAKIGKSTAVFLWANYSANEALEIIDKIINIYSPNIEKKNPGLFKNEFKPEILAEVKFLKANILSRTGNFEEALIAYKESTTAFDEIGNMERKVWTLNGTAFVYSRLSKQKTGIKYNEEAYRISKEINYTWGIGNSLHGTAHSKWGLGDNEGAIETLKQAIEIIEETDHPDAKAFLLYSLGYVYSYCGNYDEAEKHLNSALKIAREINYPDIEANAMSALAIVMAEKSDTSSAEESLLKALEFQKTAGDRHAEAWILNKIGLIKNNTGNYEAAEKYLKMSLEIFRETKSKGETAKLLMYLGNTLCTTGKYDESKKTFDECLTLAEELDNKTIKGLALCELGYLYEKTGKIKESIESLNKGIDVLKSLNYTAIKEYEDKLQELTQ